MPKTESPRQGYQQWVERFAEDWISGDTDAALLCASEAQAVWLEMFGAEMEVRSKTWDLPWPLPGCPEADDVVGWTGWYGAGYGGALA